MGARGAILATALGATKEMRMQSSARREEGDVGKAGREAHGHGAE
jgi:hypothetical protein